MKLLVLLFVLANVAAAQNAPNVQAKAFGICNSIVQANQGSVQIRCDTAMDEATRKKFLTLLNQILNNTKDTNATNKKLDSLLEFMTHLQTTSINSTASAPNGIANAEPNMGQQTVNNYGNTQYPLAGQIPNIRVCVAQSVQRNPNGPYTTSITLTTDTRISRPVFMFYFDRPVKHPATLHLPGIGEYRQSRDTNYIPTENTEGFYVTTIGSISETSWYPSSKIGLEVESENAVHVLRIEGASGSVDSVNQIHGLQENITMVCN